MKEQIGFFGLGIMGQGMLRNLLSSGFNALVWNRSPKGLEPFVSESGVEVAASVPEIFERCDLVMSCLTKAEILEAMLPDILERPVKAKIYCDLSTSAPSLAESLAERFAAQGVAYLDCPVSGGDIGAAKGQLVVMVGGEPAAFESARPALESFSKLLRHCGPAGSGQRMKCVNQVAVALSVASMTEALQLAESSELDLELVLELLGAGAAGSWTLQNYAPRLLRDDLAPGFKAKDMLKDLRFALELASDSDSQLPATSLITEMYEKLCEVDGEGLGNHALKKIY